MKKIFSKENLNKFFYSFVWLGVLLFAADLISKWAVQLNVKPTDSIDIIPNFLHVILTHNLGASFSLFASSEIGWRIAWIIISVVMSAVLIFIFIKYNKKFSKLQKVGIIMMIAGALGNMIDRAFYWNNIVGFDGVIDWIDFQFGSYHFATFNIADSSLVIGVAILIIIEIISAIKEAIAKGKRGEYDLPPAEIEKQKTEEKIEEDAKDSSEQ